MREGMRTLGVALVCAALALVLGFAFSSPWVGVVTLFGSGLLLMAASYVPPISNWSSWLRLGWFAPGGFREGDSVYVEMNLEDVPATVVRFEGRPYRPSVLVRLQDGMEIPVPAGVVRPRRGGIARLWSSG